MNNFLESQDPMSKGAGYYNPLLTEAQDATALEMASYNNQPMRKEDFSILSTSQDGIINTLNVLSDEISKHTSIIINKINEVRDELVPKKEQGNGKKKNTAALPAEKKDISLPTAPIKISTGTIPFKKKKIKKILPVTPVENQDISLPTALKTTKKKRKRKNLPKPQAVLFVNKKTTG